jgi:hypothetical protein
MRAASSALKGGKMLLTSPSGRTIYVESGDVKRVYNTADYGAESPHTHIRTQDGQIISVVEPNEKVIEMMTEEKSAAAHARLHAAENQMAPVKLALSALAASLEAAGGEIRGEDPSLMLRAVSRMMFAASQQIVAALREA